VGFKDWLKEVNEQLDQYHRDEINEEYKNNPKKRDRALRRLEAFSKPGTPLFQPEPEPDLTGMDTDDLEELSERTQADIDTLQQKLAQLNTHMNRLQQNSSSPPGGLLHSAADALRTVGEASLSEQLNSKKKLLRVIKLKLNKPTSASTPADPEQRILDEIRNVRLWEANELANETDPEIRDDIQRMAKKKLDRLRNKF
jgi:hypothetical protein